MADTGTARTDAADGRDNREGSYRIRSLAAVCLGAEVVLLLLLAGVLQATGGVFVYTLDDPYIHLRLSENISQGHYGINPGEPSSPSSSILFPFVLSLTAGTVVHAVTPFLVTILCLVATAAILANFFWQITRGHTPDPLKLPLFTLLLMAALNHFGLAFSGMEHSVHILATVAGIGGLVVLIEKGEARWWLLAALIASPLIRFEGASLTLVGIVMLVRRGRRKEAGAVVLAISAAFGLYAAFLTSLGLPLLPSSVLAKSPEIASTVEGVGLGGIAESMARNLVLGLDSRQGLLLTGLILGTAGLPLLNRRHPQAAEGAMAALTIGGLHLLMGKYNWFHRYEAYVLTALAMLMAYQWRDLLGAMLARRKPATAFVGLSLWLWIAGFPYIYGGTLSVPSASANIHQQQYQMARFAKEFYGGAVAVNDLGLVSYGNPHFVLDLWGLASEEARRQRMGTNNHEWAGRLVDKHRIGLVMIYDDWLSGALDDDWEPLAYLHLAGKRVSVAGEVVTFYATPHGDKQRIRSALAAFAATLPPGVRLTLS